MDRIPGQIEETTTQLSEISHKISIFEEKGVAEKLKKQATYITDQARLESAKNKIANALKALKSASGKSQEVASSLFDCESEYNAELMDDLKTSAGINESLKAQNQMMWIQKVNAIAKSAEEIVMKEMIYC